MNPLPVLSASGMPPTPLDFLPAGLDALGWGVLLGSVMFFLDIALPKKGG